MGKNEAPFIQCDNLVKVYRIGDQEVFALQGLDLTVAQGELMAIVGASGSGKSTLLNILGGLDRPTAGMALVGGMNLLKLSSFRLNEYRRHKVGFVWQQTSRNLIPYISAVENVELLMTLAGKTLAHKRSWARSLLDSVGLGNRMRHRLAQLSGGEQQRVAIAVALANKPNMLLADEPTGELDSVTSTKILDIFRKLNQELKITILIVTHDESIAAHVDRVVAIRDGKTSMERIRIGSLQDSSGDRTRGGPHEAPGPDGDQPSTQEPSHYHEYVVLDSAGRLQIPPEYREKLNIGDRVELDLVDRGILIRPVAGRGWESKGEQSDDE